MQASNKQPAVKNLLRVGVPAVAIVAALGTAGAMAYFTDTDSATNNFQVAAPLDIDLTEPLWDNLPDENGNDIPDEAEAMVPLQTVVKDPKVTNECDDVDAFMFLKVKVPTANVRTVAADGSIADAASHELFTYEVNEEWTEIGTAELKDGYTIHTYKYNEIVKPGDTTATLFDSVTLINIVDEALGSDASRQQIDIDAYGIQSAGFDNADQAWAAYTAQNAA